MKKVLLIDDDQDEKELFEYALSTLPVPTEFAYASDGEDALTLIQRNDFTRPDYIFLDLNMPKVGGLQFLTELRERHMYPGVPVFIYTTSATGPDIDHCVQLGGRLFTKHNSLNDLCAGLSQRIG